MMAAAFKQLPKLCKRSQVPDYCEKAYGESKLGFEEECIYSKNH